MSIYPSVIKEDLLNLSILAEKQKNQRVIEIKNRVSKQTHDKKISRKFITYYKKTRRS